MEFDEPKRIDIITFLAPISDHTISHLIDLTHTAQTEGSAEIHLHISSPGGRLYAAFTAYNFLRSLHLPFYTHNIGSIESTALMLYLASDCRSISPNCKFVLDNFEWTFPNVHVRLAELEEAHNLLSFDVQTYVRIFEERTAKGYDVAACLSGASVVMSPDDAAKAGIVNESVSSPVIPELAKLWMVRN